MYKILWFFISILGRLTPTARLKIANFLAILLHRIFRIRRSIIHSNLIHCFPDLDREEIHQLAEDSWRNLVLNALEMFQFASISKVEVCRDIQLVGTEHVDQALKEKNGVLFLALHMGNWEIMAAASGLRFSNLTIIAKPLKPKFINRLVTDLRAAAGVTLINQRERHKSARAILKEIKSNHCIGYMMDQYRPADLEVPFFGKETRTNSGLAIFAERTKAAVIPVHSIRLPSGKHQVVFQRPVEHDFSGKPKDNLYQNTLKYNQILEKMIRENKGQWLWMHKRWR